LCQFSNRKESHWIAVVQRVGVEEGERAEDVGEVAAGFVEDSLLDGGEVVVAVSGVGVFVDGDDCAVFAEE
jgi:hypothetical protein